MCLPAWLAAVVACTLAGCVNAPEDACRVPHPPATAAFHASGGVELAVFPQRLLPGGEGCQRVWIGDGRERASMRALATLHREQGRIVRLQGQDPTGPAYDCRYVEGMLDVRASSGADGCPARAEDIGRRWPWAAQ